jgi:hypothetical protein
MAGVTRIPRSRGSLCGLLLVLLGAWGGLAPFVGPYFKFAFTPDKAWAYTSGRLYLSIVPGAAALLGGLLILVTRSRAVGVTGGLLAALGGAWFAAGQGIMTTLLKRPSISAGRPLSRSGTGVSPATYEYLEILAFFVGLGILIIFIGAIAMGRFSMVAARDQVTTTADDEDSGYDNYLDAGAPSAAADPYSATAATSGYPVGQRPFPGEEPTQAQDRFPSSDQFQATGQFPTATGRFPSPSGQFPQSSSSFGSPADPD